MHQRSGQIRDWQDIQRCWTGSSHRTPHCQSAVWFDLQGHFANSTRSLLVNNSRNASFRIHN